MTSPPARRVRALSIHAGYRCRNTGVCCSSGWDISVEPEVETRLRSALRSGTLRAPGGRETASAGATPEEACFRHVSGLPQGARVALAADASGRCVLLDADRRCAVHRQLGPGALPAACRDFPRVVTLTPLGVSITLSHYCPTAAAMLFPPVILRDPRQPGPEGSAVHIIENPPAFPPSWPYEGLDARDALPPLLRPGVLMDWASLGRWESFAVSVLGGGAHTPEAALGVLAAAAEEARRWTPEEGAFEEYFVRVLSSRGAPSGRATRDPQRGSTPRTDGGPLARERHSDALGMMKSWSLLADCVPRRALVPPPPGGLDDADARWVAPAWPSLALPVRRWLAAKAFASWLALQGEGLRTTVLGLRVALGVLRAEAARGSAAAGRVLDAELLTEAIRRADLLLVHLADPEALAHRLARHEGTIPARARRQGERFAAPRTRRLL